ncbi:hypothetical protein Tco_1024344 [Tanacetum coccineum]
MRRVHTFVLIESESERVIPELAAGSSKRDAEEELIQESSKRQKMEKAQNQLKNQRIKKKKNCHKKGLDTPNNDISSKARNNVDSFTTTKIYKLIGEDLVKLLESSKREVPSTEPTEAKEKYGLS